jgi:hypothetical protein
MNKSFVNGVLNKYIAGNIEGAGFRVPAEKTELCDLALKYRTDKCEAIKHPFTHFYFDLLSPQKRSIKKVLEIGVGLKRPGSHSENRTGASLYMWKDFLPSALIYGADIDPLTMFRDGRIKTFLCDQSKKEDLENLIRQTGSNLDLVIDDASHDPSLQISTCQTLMPLLHKDVLYIIEDVANQGIERRLRMFDTTVISLRASNGRRYPDDKLIVVRNKDVWSS